jgi:hypothetical protein
MNKPMASSIQSSMRSVLKNPQKFYYLLLLSGYSSTEAQNIMYDLKFPYIRMNSPEARKKIIIILTKLVNLISTDSMLYSRMRALASEKGLHEMDTSSGIAGLPPEEPFGIIAAEKHYKKKHKHKRAKNFVIGILQRRNPV